MNRDLRFLTASLFVWGIGEGLFFYFQPIYLQKLGASPTAIGAILGAGGLILSFAHIPAGAVADRFGRRPVMWASWGTGLVAAFFMAAAHSLALFTVGLLLYSLSAFVIAPLNSYVTAARGKWSVQRALTLTSASFNTGAVLGSLAGGRLGELVGLESVYRFAAGLFVVSVALVLFIRPQPVVRQAQQETAVKGFRNGLAPRFWAFIGFVFVAMFALYLPQPLAPNFLNDVRGATLGNIGLFGALSRGGMVFFSMILGSFEAWSGFLMAQFAGGLFPLLIWKGTGLPWYSLAYFFVGGYWASRALSAAEVRSMVEEAAMGLAYGFNETMSGLAVFGASVLAGRLYAVNPELPFRLSVYLLPFILLGNLPFHPRWRRKPKSSGS